MHAATHPIVFRDRLDAARRLAERPQAYAGQNPLGAGHSARRRAHGVPHRPGAAGRFGSGVLVRKLGAPYQPEYAIGSVDESGWTYLSPHAAATGADAHYIATEKRRQLQLIHQRRGSTRRYARRWRWPGASSSWWTTAWPPGPPWPPRCTACASASLARLICAVPVASHEALALVRPLADEVACLQAPQDFEAVGQLLRGFHPGGG